MLRPLRDDERVDDEGGRRLLEHLIEGRVHGIFVLGTVSEGAMLMLGQRRGLVTATAEAGYSTLSFREGDTSLTLHGRCRRRQGSSYAMPTRDSLVRAVLKHAIGSSGVAE